MTKTRLTALTLIFAVFVASPVAMSAGIEKNKSTAPAYVPGEIIVKFKSASASGLTATQMKAAIGQLRGHSGRLQALHQKHGLREMKRVFAPRGKNRTMTASLKTRLERRRRRVSGGDRQKGDALDAGFARTFKLTFTKNAPIDRILAEYKKDPDVEYAEPNYIFKALELTNDPYYYSAGTWGQPYDDMWALKKVDAAAAWDITKGAGVVVAVVDSGVDYTHPDIDDNIWINTGEVAEDGIDNDGNGFIDDVRGWNFAYDRDLEPSVFGDNDPIDYNGHGTHVAGTIAAEGNNGQGIVGVAWEAKIMAIKGLMSDGSGYDDRLAMCIRYAVDNGADIINNSWGGPGYTQLLAEAAAYAHASGVVMVASAGNDGQDVTSPTNPAYPAAFSSVITVAATNTTDHRPAWSNWGSKIDVGAPGGNNDIGPSDPFATDNILSLKSSVGLLRHEWPELIVGPDERYFRIAGTSMAAPHVSGVAALILARHPSYSNEDVRQVLRISSNDVDAPGFDTNTGYGRVNAYRAVINANLAGSLDVADNQGVVGGWALDRARPERSIDVHIYLYEQGAASPAGGYVIHAAQDRPDVNQALGVTGRHGFSWTVPGQFRNGRTYYLFAYAVNGPNATLQLTGSPKSFSIANTAPMGFLDGFAGGTAGGWALDPDTPSQPISVHMYAQDAQGHWSFLGAVFANQPRPDVNQGTGYPGDHGFTFSVPAGYQGQTLWAWGIDAQGGPPQSLTGSGLPIP